MLNEVVPAIQSLFPTCKLSRYDTIYIQQDGAPSHIPTKNEDDMWFEEMESLGRNERIKLVTQPPNSPDLNVNDLGFFNALQSTCHSTCPRNAMELIEMVTQAYNDYPVNKINRIWLTCQGCMNEIIKIKGHNACPTECHTWAKRNSNVQTDFHWYWKSVKRELLSYKANTADLYLCSVIIAELLVAPRLSAILMHLLLSLSCLLQNLK